MRNLLTPEENKGEAENEKAASRRKEGEAEELQSKKFKHHLQADRKNFSSGIEAANEGEQKRVYEKA